MAGKANRRLGVVVGVIVIAAVVLAAFVSTWSVQERDPSTPEGVVQAYLTAVFEHRSDDAAAFLAAGSDCTAEHFDTAYVNSDARVDLVASEVALDTARVQVRVEFSSGDPFGGTYGEDHAYRLVKDGKGWHIIGIPWPLYGCGEMVK